MNTKSDESIVEAVHRLDREMHAKWTKNAKKDEGALRMVVGVTTLALVFCGIAIASVLSNGYQDLLYGTIMLLIILGAAKEAIKKLQGS